MIGTLLTIFCTVILLLVCFELADRIMLWWAGRSQKQIFGKDLPKPFWRRKKTD